VGGVHIKKKRVEVGKLSGRYREIRLKGQEGISEKREADKRIRDGKKREKDGSIGGKRRRKKGGIKKRKKRLRKSVDIGRLGW